MTSELECEDVLEAMVVFLPLEKNCKHYPEGKNCN
jgi:hypothetical protein